MSPDHWRKIEELYHGARLEPEFWLLLNPKYLPGFGIASDQGV
jgi:hypothetical protein